LRFSHKFHARLIVNSCGTSLYVVKCMRGGSVFRPPTGAPLSKKTHRFALNFVLRKKLSTYEILLPFMTKKLWLMHLNYSFSLMWKSQ